MGNWTLEESRQLQEWVLINGHDRGSIKKFADKIQKPWRAVYEYGRRKVYWDHQRRWSDAEIERLKMWANCFGRSRAAIQKFLLMEKLPFSYQSALHYVDRLLPDETKFQEQFYEAVYSEIVKRVPSEFDAEEDPPPQQLLHLEITICK